MKASRWPHTITVEVVGGIGEVRLVCDGCGWQSPAQQSPTVSALTQEAWEHRRAMRSES